MFAEILSLLRMIEWSKLTLKLAGGFSAFLLLNSYIAHKILEQIKRKPSLEGSEMLVELSGAAVFSTAVSLLILMAAKMVADWIVSRHLEGRVVKSAKNLSEASYSFLIRMKVLNLQHIPLDGDIGWNVNDMIHQNVLLVVPSESRPGNFSLKVNDKVWHHLDKESAVSNYPETPRSKLKQELSEALRD